MMQCLHAGLTGLISHEVYLNLASMLYPIGLV